MQRLLVPALLLLTGCALSSEMPPIAASSLGRMPAGTGLHFRTPLPAAHSFQHHRRFTTEADSASGLTRVAVTTNPGRYFLWVQRPRLTFFYDYPSLRLQATPEVVPGLPDPVPTVCDHQSPDSHL